MLPVFRYCSLFIAILLIICGGCGAPKAPYKVVALEGTISFKGEPLDNVSLQFIVGDIRPSGALAQGGKFQAIHTQNQVGVPVGTCTLTLSWAGDDSPPAAYRELFAKYGMNTAGYVFEVTQADKNVKIDLE